jgi:hypothetical protein
LRVQAIPCSLALQTEVIYGDLPAFSKWCEGSLEGDVVFGYYSPFYQYENEWCEL